MEIVYFVRNPFMYFCSSWCQNWGTILQIKTSISLYFDWGISQYHYDGDDDDDDDDNVIIISSLWLSHCYCYHYYFLYY